MQKIINILILITLVFSILFFILKDDFNIRISLKFENLCAQSIDNMVSKNLSDILLKTKYIKDFYIVSSSNYCNIYLKTSRSKQKEEITSLISNVLSKSGLEPEIEYDFNYDKIYNTYIVFTSKEVDFSTLKKYSDIVFNEMILDKKIKKILDFQKDELVNYIYFKNSDLINYSTNPTEIKKLIRKNNSTEDIIKYDDKFDIFFNSKINSIEDIENIPIFYQNKNFSANFKQIFKIEEKCNQDYSVKFKNKEAKLLALSKSPFCPNFLLKLKIKKISKNFPNYISIEVLKPKNKDLIFINSTPPRITKGQIFQEIQKDKIYPYQNKQKTVKIKNKNLNELNKFIKNNYQNYTSDTFKTKNAIKFILNNEDLNSYLLDKNEVIDNIKANTEGLICDYYFKNSSKIKIILKNETQDEFIYSKNYKNLISYSSFLTTDLKEEFEVITRKKGEFYALLYLNN